MIKTSDRIQLVDFLQEQSDRFQEVIGGLTAPEKRLEPKFLYDQYGSELFEEITQLEEYYPTRTELAIMEECLDEILSFIGKDSRIIEFGSGASRKIRLLLASGMINEYCPIDISKSFLKESIKQLSSDYTDIKITGIVADYTTHLKLPDHLLDASRKKTVFFPGSTIGNFDKDEALKFLTRISSVLSSQDGLLIGVDLKKSPARLHQAYNDESGVTAQFNLNILRHLNREYRAQFNLEQFEHYAYYNSSLGRIEMHLVSLLDQHVGIGDHTIQFREHESIHTENSYKYGIKEFQQLAENAGFLPMKTWTDKERLFSLHYFSVK
ncbi:L-histidine N(alpha)-methyltransferase [Bacillus sp. es.036]|uniref:L-histidine N(alpha)-methyltransferase n=1 Tax=Bacillus sp. es.036 TaxID=1761764 RepID=UPI000BF6B261|nr:L-histidine N(alpha)-methyltransferase [Bacillus sp. es.036]PFG13255.1 dimethylhistidine N-methyltransferase [Bacillus sp. es.036]